MFENHGYIHLYSPGTGADNILRSIIFLNSIIQSIWSFAASFPQLNDLNYSFPHSNVQMTQFDLAVK